MKNVVHYLTRVVVALVAITTAGLASAAYNFVDLNYEGAAGIQVFGTNDKGLVAGGVDRYWYHHLTFSTAHGAAVHRTAARTARTSQ